jgi:hypothetical protein
VNRRTFLSSTMIGSIGLLGASSRALGFADAPCVEAATPACKTVAEHAELRERIDAYLRQKGLSDVERARILARSVCPFCGGPLL